MKRDTKEIYLFLLGLYLSLICTAIHYHYYRCGFPVCSVCQFCDGQLAQHGPECGLLTRNGVKMNLVTMCQAKISLSVVSVLRLLLMDGWKHLESHAEKEKNTKQGKFRQKHIIPLIKNLRDAHGNQLFTEVNIYQFWP